MESVLARGSNGQAIDLVVVKNAADIATTGTETVSIYQGHEHTSDGGNIEGAWVISHPSGAVASTVTVAPVVGRANYKIDSNSGGADTLTATRLSLFGPEFVVTADDQYNGCIARFFLKAGATLNAAIPFTGASSPHKPKGYVDVVITDSDNAGDYIEFADSEALLGLKASSVGTDDAGCLVDHVTILPAVRFSNISGNNIEAGDLKAIVVVARER